MAVRLYTNEEILAEAEKPSASGSLNSVLRGVLNSDLGQIKEYEEKMAEIESSGPAPGTYLGRSARVLFLKSLVLVERERATATLNRLKKFDGTFSEASALRVKGHTSFEMLAPDMSKGAIAHGN